MVQLHTKIIFTATGVQTIARLAAIPGAPVVWIVQNDDPNVASHSVTIDPTTFTPYNPFTSTTPISITVPKHGRQPMYLVIKSSVPYPTSFKYTPSLSVAGEKPRTIDPDLDVVDPGSII